jgi:uncharacterized protein (TIGR03083 family)
MSQDIVDKMAQVWRSIEALCADLTETEWKTPTACPGWSVQDQLSHLAGAEANILGRDIPDHTPADMSHVKNDIGKRNEVNVDWRRSWPGSRVLEEFRELTSQRLTNLRAMRDEDFAAETQTPIGPGTMSLFLQIRIFDAWIHEQDMRRALGRPGHLDGPVAEHSVGRVALAMPMVVGRRAQAADGTTVVFTITGGAGRTIPIRVEGGRARLLDAPPDHPNVHLTMDVDAFTSLGCGRWDVAQALADGRVHIEGDRALGETIVQQMNIMI